MDRRLIQPNAKVLTYVCVEISNFEADAVSFPLSFEDDGFYGELTLGDLIRINNANNL